MKKIRLILILLLAVPWLLSCSSGDAAELWDAKGDIVELLRLTVDPVPEDTPGTPAVPPDDASERMLRGFLHTELLPSPYNAADDPATVASLSGAPLTEPDTEWEAPAAETDGYLLIPSFASRLAEDVTAVLSYFGIVPEVEKTTNMAPAGEVFALTYSGFSDRNGYYVNPSEPVTLFVSAEKRIVPEKSGKNLVYLTFDDGPTESDTRRLLDILDRYGVKGTFFTIGNSVAAYPESARLIAERGHQLACHTMTHVYKKIYASADALEKEILAWEQAVSDAGIQIQAERRMFRFPGGSIGQYLTDAKLAEMKEMLARHGYLAFDWNVVTNDGMLYLAPEDESTYDYLRQNFLDTLEGAIADNRKIKDENAPLIVLMHEVTPETIDLMPWVIETFLERGFSFGTLSDRASTWLFKDH